MSVVLNTTVPSSVLKKKQCACAYHRIRESIAAGAVPFAHVSSKHNLADVDLEGHGSTRVLVRLLVLAPVPAANAAPVEPPVADVPNPPDNDAVYVADEHPDFPDASLNLFMSNHATILPSMDELCSLFAEHGFGQRSAVIAYFGSRLRLAEDRVVANHASIPPADADFVILDDDE
jgi:hypothetical protein